MSDFLLNHWQSLAWMSGAIAVLVGWIGLSGWKKFIHDIRNFGYSARVILYGMLGAIATAAAAVVVTYRAIPEESREGVLNALPPDFVGFVQTYVLSVTILFLGGMGIYWLAKTLRLVHNKDLSVPDGKINDYEANEAIKALMQKYEGLERRFAANEIGTRKTPVSEPPPGIPERRRTIVLLPAPEEAAEEPAEKIVEPEPPKEEEQDSPKALPFGEKVDRWFYDHTIGLFFKKR